MVKKKTKNVDKRSENLLDLDLIEIKANCPHLTRGVDIGYIKRAWKKKTIVGCQMCTKKQVSAEKYPGVEIDTLVCMNCGHISCGNSRENHAVKHFKMPHSDCHSVVAIVDTWDMRCLLCRCVIDVQKNVRADDALQFLRNKVVEIGVAQNEAQNELDYIIWKNNISFSDMSVLDNKQFLKTLKDVKLYPILGLANIGNTCYINAVLQCLAQTPSFVKDLEASCQQVFSLTGGENLVPEEHGGHLPPLNGLLEEGGDLIQAAHRVLSRIRSGENLRKTGVTEENPGELIKILNGISNMFQMGEQHDSHELLRYLLQGIRMEDLKRYNHGIMKALDITVKEDFQPKEKALLSAYAEQVIKEKLVIERLFGGTFISMRKCLECDNVTKSFETFLDISLPIESEKVKISAKKSLPVEVRVPKHQQKKEKRKEKKAAKRMEKRARANRVTGEAPSSPLASKSDHTVFDIVKKSDADVKDDSMDSGRTVNMESDSSMFSLVPESEPSPLNNCANSTETDEELQILEVSSCDTVMPSSTFYFDLDSSGDLKDLVGQEEIEIGRNILYCDTNCSPVIQPLVPHRSPTFICSGYNQNSSDDGSVNDDFGSLEGGRGSAASSIAQSDWADYGEYVEDTTEDIHEYIVVEEGNTSHLNSPVQDSLDTAFRFLEHNDNSVYHRMAMNEVEGFRANMSDLNMPLEYSDNVTLEVSGNERNNDSIKKHSCHMNKLENEIDNFILDPYVHSSVEHSKCCSSYWGKTIAQPSGLESVVNSLEHCLEKFFGEEVLSGQNKIGCTHCTQMVEQKTPSPCSKLIQTNTMKQLLLVKLPEILTIHLKRFEVIGARMSKISRKITYPETLDISPYCSVKLEVPEEGESLTYQLFGVIQHSGHISRGHYIAYVKVDEDRNDQQLTPEKIILTGSEEVLVDEPPCEHYSRYAGKWFQISDTLVKETTLKEVLGAEAYILFYRKKR